MAEAPANAGNPGAFGTSYGKRSNGRQMIGAGQDMDRAGEHSSDGCNHGWRNLRYRRRKSKGNFTPVIDRMYVSGGEKSQGNKFGNFAGRLL